MGKQKHYTPALEEFHIGFKFEYLASGGKLLKDHPDNWERWERSVVDKDWFDRILEDFEENDVGLMDTEEVIKYRVKYLDQQDIEELGWIPDEKGSQFTFVGREDEIWGDCADCIRHKFTLTLSTQPGVIRLKRHDNGGFMGMVDHLAYSLDMVGCRNYNELERLMKTFRIQ
jgi:hypothetical protein